MSLYDVECRKQIGVGAFNTDPDPAVRLENWRNIARAHITPEICMGLAEHGFAELAAELMRQIGEIE